MNGIPIKTEKWRPPAPEGLRDGGHVHVSCSNCRAWLLDVWRTRPHEPHTWKVKATCPFCGDESFVVEVKGGFHPGGAARSKDEEPDEDDYVSTRYDPPEIVDDVIVFKVIKNEPDSKPIRAR